MFWLLTAVFILPPRFTEHLCDLAECDRAGGLMPQKVFVGRMAFEALNVHFVVVSVGQPGALCEKGWSTKVVQLPGRLSPIGCALAASPYLQTRLLSQQQAYPAQ